MIAGKSAVLWVGLIAGAGAFTYHTSYQVQGMEETLGSLNRKIMGEQETIQVLKAEWSYLNDPSRLENLAETYLKLRPTDGRQFVSLDAIPFRPADATAPNAAPNGTPLPAPLPPMAGLSQPAPGIIPASAVARPQIRPSDVIPAAARVPVVPAAAPSARASEPKRHRVQPTEVAFRPVPAPSPAPVLKLPAARHPHPTQTAAAAPPLATDSIGVLVARLGANR